MLQFDAKIVSNHLLQSSYYLLTVDAPEVCELAAPGQFVHVRIPGFTEGILRRPFSIYKAHDGQLAFIYKVVGKGTAKLSSAKAGETINLLAPLGRGFDLTLCGDEIPVLVAGGYGVAPLAFLARRLDRTGVVCIGGKTQADILCVDEFDSIGWRTLVSTEDGSLGYCGLVTEVLKNILSEMEKKIRVYACGPLGMLRAIAEMTVEAGIKTQLSFDRHMCCGVGACWTCVIPVKKENGWQYSRVCKNGPVFDAELICWERLE